MMHYKVHVEFFGDHKKRALKHFVNSTINNNRYNDRTVEIYIEYIKIYKKLAVADLKIIDKRYESVGNNVRDLDIQFDRLSDDCKCDKSMTMRICWFDFTSDGHEGKNECDKLCAKLVKRNNVYNNKYHYIAVYKNYNCGMAYMDITCFKGHRIIPLIYLTTYEENNK